MNIHVDLGAVQSFGFAWFWRWVLAAIALSVALLLGTPSWVTVVAWVVLALLHLVIAAVAVTLQMREERRA